jgi:Tol biopolymer transport system component
VADDTTVGFGDVFVHDRDTDNDNVMDEDGAISTERVSVDSSEIQANGDSSDPRISPDGGYVTFNSGATNLVAGDTNGVFDVFVRDRAAGTTQRASVAGRATQANNSSFGGVISANGRYVAFTSNASNLVKGDTNGLQDVYVRDLQARTTERVSVAADRRAQPLGGSFFP